MHIFAERFTYNIYVQVLTVLVAYGLINLTIPLLDFQIIVCGNGKREKRGYCH